MGDLRQIIADEIADRFENDDTLDLPPMEHDHLVIDTLARAVADRLLALPVEQRMAAMGMECIAGWWTERKMEAGRPGGPCEHAVWSYTSGKTPTGYWSRPTTCDCEWPESERPVAAPQAPRRRRTRG